MLLVKHQNSMMQQQDKDHLWIGTTITCHSQNNKKAEIGSVASSSSPSSTSSSLSSSSCSFSSSIQFV